MLFQDIPSRTSASLLGISENLLIYKVYEEGFVTDGKHTHTIGSLYGDPSCAAIAKDETWCAIGGSGVEILLAEQGQTLAREWVGDTFGVSALRVEGIWVEAMWALGPRQLGIVTSPSSSQPDRRLLVVDVDSREVTGEREAAGD